MQPFDPPDPGGDLVDVAHPVRVAARRVIEATLQQLFGRLLGLAAVFAHQRRAVEQRRRPGVDQAFEHVGVAPDALVALGVGDDRHQLLLDPQIGQPPVDAEREVALVELEQHGALTRVGQRLVVHDAREDHVVEIVLGREVDRWQIRRQVRAHAVEGGA